MHDATRSGPRPHAVDNTDWLKTAAIIFVSVDHFGFFFMEDELWWSVFGRFAAPPFFFLMGYAESRAVPLHWIGIGVILTLLESWNADWTWVAPNILLSFVLIRIARPYGQMLLQNRPSRVATFSSKDCRLRRGGMAVGAVRSMSAPISQRHIRGHRRNTRVASTHAERDRCRWPDAPFGLLGRRGRLRLAGTKGILVSGSSFGGRYPWPRGFVHQPVSIHARREPLPTPGEGSRHSSLRRSAHPGNLRYPTCRL